MTMFLRNVSTKLSTCCSAEFCPLLVMVPVRHFRPLASGGVQERNARFMKKLITGSSKTKKKFFNVELTSSKTLKEFENYKLKSASPSSSSTFAGQQGKSKKRILTGKPLRRQETLNNIFMKQITSLMSTGEVADELVGLGIQVSDVRVTNDFNYINIFWVASGLESEDFIDAKLKNVGAHLRHELSSLRTIGIVPPFQFIKDVSRTKIMEVERRIAIADMGPDYVPLHKGEILKSYKVIDSRNISSQVIEAIENIDNSDESSPTNTTTSLEEPEFDMRDDVLGIPHTKIMNRIKLGMEKLKKLQLSRREQILKEERLKLQEQQSSDLTYNSTDNDTTTNFEEIQKTASENALIYSQVEKMRRSDFAKFLKAQRIAKQKVMKMYTTKQTEKEFYDQEAELKLNQKVEELEDFVVGQNFEKFYDQDDQLFEPDDSSHAFLDYSDKDIDENENSITFDDYQNQKQ